jgi:hypothetical protein
VPDIHEGLFHRRRRPVAIATRLDGRAVGLLAGLKCSYGDEAIWIQARPAVLATGCSSGIGRAAANSPHDARFPVHASDRNAAIPTAPAGRGIRTPALDATDERAYRR